MADDGPNPKSSSSSMASAAPRPTIALPPRSTFESLFRGGVADVSPGPLTLVSSFFADDPDGDCRSFSQLHAGAMASPAAARREAAMEEVKDEEERPLRMAPQSQSPSPFFMVPAGLSPSGLLESPAVFSNNLVQTGLAQSSNPPTQDVWRNGRKCSRSEALLQATGINYGAAATDWESMDSEALSRPDQKDKSIGSESGRVPVVDQPAVLPQEST